MHRGLEAHNVHQDDHIRHMNAVASRFTFQRFWIAQRVIDSIHFLDISLTWIGEASGRTRKHTRQPTYIHIHHVVRALSVVTCTYHCPGLSDHYLVPDDARSWLLDAG